MKKKLIVDILLFILMLLEFSKVLTGQLIHEIIGIALFILVIIHLIFNRVYISSIFKKKYNLKSLIMLLTNCLLIIFFILTSVFGILSSEEFLRFLNIHSVSIIKLHRIFGYICLLIVGIHLGINFNAMFGTITKKIKNKVVNFIIGLIIIGFGIYSFIDLDYCSKLTGNMKFGMVSNSVILILMEYLSVIMMVTIVINFIYKRIKSSKD